MAAIAVTETLAETAQRAEAALVGWRVERLRRALSGPLVVVGAGGSRGLAELWARLHARKGMAAWAMTPQELVDGGAPAKATVLLLSASGRHHDVLAAARAALAGGRAVHAVTTAPDTPLDALIREGRPENQAVVLPAPGVREGLAGRHEGLPMVVLAARLYAGGGPFAPRFEVEATPMPSGRPRDVVVLGSGLAAPAAMDFAQKLRECGFAPARQTDPRDFAHGDFMAFDAAQTWMVAFGHGAQLAYLGRYLDPLPAELSVARVFDPDPGAAGAIGLFARARASFAALVEAHALHPGPADVPRWAGRLYQLPLDG